MNTVFILACRATRLRVVTIFRRSDFLTFTMICLWCMTGCFAVPKYRYQIERSLPEAVRDVVEIGDSDETDEAPETEEIERTVESHGAGLEAGLHIPLLGTISFELSPTFDFARFDLTEIRHLLKYRYPFFRWSKRNFLSVGAGASIRQHFDAPDKNASGDSQSDDTKQGWSGPELNASMSFYRPPVLLDVSGTITSSSFGFVLSVGWLIHSH